MLPSVETPLPDARNGRAYTWANEAWPPTNESELRLSESKPLYGAPLIREHLPFLFSHHWPASHLSTPHPKISTPFSLVQLIITVHSVLLLFQFDTVYTLYSIVYTLQSIPYNFSIYCVLFIEFFLPMFCLWQLTCNLTN